MRKALAVIFAILFVFPLVLAAQVSIGAISFALDRDFYIGAISSGQVYEAIMSKGIIGQFIHQRLDLPPAVNTQEIEEVLQTVITEDYVQEQTRSVVNSIFNYLQGVSDSFELVVDISPLKESLQGETQDELLSAIVTSLPVCEPGQTPGFGSEGQTPCKPAGVPDELVAAQLAPSVPAIIEDLPDEVTIVKDWKRIQDRVLWTSFLPGMALPAAALLSVIFLCFIVAAFWFIGALIADDSWRVRLQWLGWVLIVPSILVLFIGLAVGSSIPNYWVRYGLEQARFGLAHFGPASTEILRILMRSALPRVSSAFIIVGGISGALGVGLVFWGLATSRSKPKTEKFES